MTVKIYKFKDQTDGNHAFILAQSESEAWGRIKQNNCVKMQIN